MFEVFKQKKETDAEVYEAILYNFLKVNKHEIIQITLLISYLCCTVINHLV